MVRLKKTGGPMALLGIAAFAERFAGTWPVVDLGISDEENDGDDGLFPTKPIKGAQVFAGPAGRAYHQTMALLVSEKVGTEVTKRERGLFSSGFRHVGDIMCDAFENVAIRGYARPNGDSWACFRVSAPDEIQFELASIIDEGGTVVTPGGDGANVKETVAQHDRKIAEIKEKGGVLQTAAANLRGFAEALDKLL